MATATWNGQIVAEVDSEKTVVVENNVYFPLSAVNAQMLKPSAHHTTCPWKGVASYYDVEVDGKTNSNAAWYYPEPSAAAMEIKGKVAFWRGVIVRP